MQERTKSETSQQKNPSTAVDSAAEIRYTVSDGAAHLENFNANEKERPIVQTCFGSRCKVTLQFSASPDRKLRQDVARMLLSAFRRIHTKE